MEHPVLTRTIEKLARAGEEAGISVEDMLWLLHAGVSVETLLGLIERNYRACGGESVRSSRWVV
jgi:hypothetical protein